jgi:DNA-directed RNA polymerase subunit M/transcription elongation factor TFIIS
MCDTLRLKGIKSLQISNSPEDAERYERAVYEITKNHDDFESEYKRGIFQLVNTEKPKMQSKINPSISIGWQHECYKTFRDLIKEQDDFLIKPFEVEEGVLECKCGSRRVLSYSKQCRSSDEPMTTFATCMKCKSSWTYNG